MVEVFAITSEYSNLLMTINENCFAIVYLNFNRKPHTGPSRRRRNILQLQESFSFGFFNLCNLFWNNVAWLF